METQQLFPKRRKCGWLVSLQVSATTRPPSPAGV
jgi:hypothetical protein